MRTLYLLFLVFLAAPVSAKEGFTLRWSYEAEEAFTSLAAMDMNKSGYLDYIIAGSVDNNVYVFSQAGDMLGSYEAGSSVTSVAAFVHDGDGKLNDGVAGSLDDYVYAFWRPYGKGYFRSSPYWWNYSTGDNVYAVGVFDYNRSRQLDGVVGVGNYADREYGRVLAFSWNGTNLWNYSTSAAVKVLTHADLDSDNIMDDVVVGAGKSVYVLDSLGSLIWKYDLSEEVYALSYADFDLDGEKDDILIGAGNATYAVDSHKKLLWRQDFNGTVSSITAVDRDSDGVLDYYLVASGSVVYALMNGDKALLLWQYNLGYSIDAHVSLDFDNDGVLDDLAIISGNSLIAYDFDYLYLPELQVSKNASAGELLVGERVRITLKLENRGDGKATEVSFTDAVPEGFKLVGGNLSWRDGSISPRREDEVHYTLEAIAEGSYELPAAKLSYYSDSYGNSYTALSNPLTIEVKALVDQENNQTREEGRPEVVVSRSFSKENISLGENLTVTVILQNLGEKAALTVNFEDEVPEGFALVEGEGAWSGVLNPGESMELSYTLELKNAPDEGEIRFGELVVYYRDDSGEIYEAVGEGKTLLVVEEFKYKRLIYALLLVVVVAAVVYRRFSKPEKVDPKLEEKFIQVYLRYQRRGERPTYEAMKEELGVDMKELDNIVRSVKRKFGIGPFNALFSRIKGLRK